MLQNKNFVTVSEDNSLIVIRFLLERKETTLAILWGDETEFPLPHVYS